MAASRTRRSAARLSAACSLRPCPRSSLFPPCLPSCGVELCRRLLLPRFPMQPENTSQQVLDQGQSHQDKPASGVSRNATKWFLLVPVLLAIAGAVTLSLRARGSRALAATTQAMEAEPVTV